MDTFFLPSTPPAGSAAPVGGQGGRAASPDAAPSLEVRFEEILTSIFSPFLDGETGTAPAPAKDGGIEENVEPASTSTVDASVLLAGVPPGLVAAAAPPAGETAFPADAFHATLASPSGSGGVTAEVPEAASEAAQHVAAGAFPGTPMANAPLEEGREPASAPVPDAKAVPHHGTRQVSGTADRPGTGGAALPEDAFPASMPTPDGPAVDAPAQGAPRDTGSRTAVSTYGAPAAAPSNGARNRVVEASTHPSGEASPASPRSGGKPGPASGEDASGSAVNLSGTPETVGASEASSKKRGEAPFRGEERVEPTAPQAVAVERIAADKADAPRSPAPAPAASHAPRPVLLGENAFVLTRKSDTSVEVTLAPPGVGKLEIEVVVEKGVVNANITAADPAGREAIERSLPHIMEALARDGMAIGGFTVSLKERREQAGNAPGGRAPRSPMDRPPVSTIVPTAAASAGLVDLFV